MNEKTKAEQLAAKFRQMRELNEYGKASVQDVADELERLSPMEAERDKLIAVNKVLVDALVKAREDINWMLNSAKFLNGFVFAYLDAALKLAGEIK